MAIANTRGIRIAAVLVLAPFSPANATGKIVTFSGIIGDGFDTAGYFGTPNSSLIGSSYKAVFRYNKSQAINVTTTPESDYVVGVNLRNINSIDSNIFINGFNYSASGFIN